MRFRYPAKTNDAKDLVLGTSFFIVIKRPMENRNECCSISQPLLKAGQKYAIVGKAAQASQHYSSLLTDGAKTIADRSAWETEIKEFLLEELQDNATVIDQRPFVYQASIRENLTLGQFFPDEEIRASAKSGTLCSY